MSTRQTNCSVFNEYFWVCYEWAFECISTSIVCTRNRQSKAVRWHRVLSTATATFDVFDVWLWSRNTSPAVATSLEKSNMKTKNRNSGFSVYREKSLKKSLKLTEHAFRMKRESESWLIDFFPCFHECFIHLFISFREGKLPTPTQTIYLMKCVSWRSKFIVLKISTDWLFIYGFKFTLL